MTFTPEFQEFAKISRLNREVIITEKIDGSNAAVIIEEIPREESRGLITGQQVYGGAIVVQHGGPVPAEDVATYWVGAQSRKRLLAPGKQSDMSGFASWVTAWAPQLVTVLGPGRHFGEWYGKGIQRGYGMDDKRLALFNIKRWTDDRWRPITNLGLVPGLTTVPVLGLAPSLASEFHYDVALGNLRVSGSRAQGGEGFVNPEGIVIYHPHSSALFKVTLKNDDRGKEWGA